MQVDKKDLAEKIIEAEIQKEGKRLEELVPERPRIEVSEEEEQAELQELLRKRKAYQEQLKNEEESYLKEAAARKNRRSSAIVKVAVLVLVASGCLFAFSMRSEATRMWWLTSVERVIGTDRGTVVNNDENRMISDVSVEEAIAEIEEKTGIPMPELKYQPQGMTFDGYSYDEVVRCGQMQYLYDDYIIYIYGLSTSLNSSYSWNYDGSVFYEETIETDYGTVKIMEIRSEEDEVSNFVAEWTYHNHQYKVEGKLPLEEIRLIIENILY